jgi:F-type H+-transporting ATPase subunit epsilon
MSLTLEIITPSGRVLKTVDSLRAEDLSGSFGILARHLDLLTVLRPCIVIYKREGQEGYLAVNGGILKVEKGAVTIASREAVEGVNLSELRATVESDFAKKAEKEATFMDLISNMEKLLLDNLVKFEKG